ncbi:LSU ribosomal protein L25p [Candidatus Similichlamydia laticola]|uniref:Large ribosomal subunit protein bL25 n=1 Tax=Candidatus Similichlamydia laticola TaxID=2170265 RepID=A0A369KD59_9BACT|nr:LSU ribosomal protein L25p [Candidatus Similichlamydia laticola]
MHIQKRSLRGKGFLKGLRLAGRIPAVLHDPAGSSEAISVDKKELARLFALYRGRVASVRFVLIDQEGNRSSSLVKEIQHSFVDYEILHLDFCLLELSRRVSVNVPIFLRGGEECVGLKQGGVLRQVIRRLRVKCLPDDIPSCFELDISGLQMKKSMRLSSLAIPENVMPLTDLDQVVVVVAKR